MGLIKEFGLLYLFLIFTLTGLYGQQENPFDIKNKVSKPAQSIAPSTDSATVANKIPDTQILSDISTEPPDSISFRTDTNAIVVPDSIQKDTFTEVWNIPRETVTRTDSSSDLLNNIPDLGEVLPTINRRLTNQNVLFICTVVILIFLAILMVLKRSLINQAYKAIANDNYLRFLFRDYQSYPWLYWLFYIYFFINAGFFTFLAINHFQWEVNITFYLLLVCILIFSTIYFVKFVFLELMSGTFPVGKEAHLYSFVTILINILLGLFLTPINLIVAFGPEWVVEIVIWVGLFSFILLYLFRQLKGIFISGSFFPVYRFHFFLYLCAVEIAPLLIIGKVALTKLGIQ